MPSVCLKMHLNSIFLDLLLYLRSVKADKWEGLMKIPPLFCCYQTQHCVAYWLELSLLCLTLVERIHFKLKQISDQVKHDFNLLNLNQECHAEL